LDSARAATKRDGRRSQRIGTTSGRERGSEILGNGSQENEEMTEMEMKLWGSLAGPADELGVLETTLPKRCKTGSRQTAKSASALAVESHLEEASLDHSAPMAGI
jgi:hypothetical protein